MRDGDEPFESMRSLFLVSLPRSLSSLLYQTIRPVLGLQEPVWTSDGEVLNLHRFAHLPQGLDVEGLRFTEPKRAPDRFQRLTAFLDQAIVREGFFYKDVVQPFVVASWLPASGLAALRIERPLADVAMAMLDRGWLYPQAAEDPENATGDPERDLLAGLARAHQALAAIPGPVVRFDDLIHDEEPLAAALRTLYGDVPAPRYLDDGFRAVRDEVLARRETGRWRRLAEMASPFSEIP
jgi:hypothetical protein